MGMLLPFLLIEQFIFYSHRIACAHLFLIVFLGKLSTFFYPVSLKGHVALMKSNKDFTKLLDNFYFVFNFVLLPLIQIYVGLFMAFCCGLVLVSIIFLFPKQ